MKRLFLRALFAFLALAAASAPLRAEVFYGIEANGIWSVDVNLGGPATQLTTFAAPLTSAATLATRPSDGMLFYLESQNANPTLWRWNPLTPAVPPVLLGGTGLGAGVIRLVFDAGGTLYAMNSGAGATLWTLNQNTGAFLTATPTSGAVTPGGGDICVHPSTGAMYLVAAANLYTVTPAGVVTLLGAVTGLPGEHDGLRLRPHRPPGDLARGDAVPGEHDDARGHRASQCHGGAGVRGPRHGPRANVGPEPQR